MSDYNQRQLQRMLQAILAFKGNAISLQKCINDLKALIACLEESEANLKKKLQKKWAILEEVYAVSLDKNQGALSYSQEALVLDALREMQNILAVETERKVL